MHRKKFNKVILVCINFTTCCKYDIICMHIMYTHITVQWYISHPAMGELRMRSGNST
jgi:hypothetical protein